MLLADLFESVATTPSALDQLINNANNMYTLYIDILPDRINKLYAEGQHEDVKRTAKTLVGRAKGKWFAENYLSTSSRRDKPISGLKLALLAIAKDPDFSASRGKLQQLGSFTIMGNKEKQAEVAGSSGQYVSELESLPMLMNELAPRAPGEYRDRLKLAAHKLNTSIERFYRLWTKLQADWDRDWGEPDPSQVNRERARTERAGEKQATGSQNVQVEAIINQVLSGLDKRVAAELRPILARSDNKLLTLQRELDKRGIKI